jgi:hypothetical protein
MARSWCLARALQEAEEAFALMLPNSRVELKLRTSPEYRDEIDPDSGLVRVVEVIPDGTYRHVINALKIASDLKKVGALDRLGVDKDTIVQTMIYHDLGKQQPRLAVGDLIDPREVFEPSHLHAERSAAFAAGTYVRDENVLTLIRHHHHREEELPDTFPARLLPMLRIVRLIDGLSAAVTRNRARLTVGMEGNEIVVHEDNPRPQYCGTHRLEPFSGRYELVPDR